MPPVLAEFLVVEPAEQVRVVVEPVGCLPHLVVVVPAVAGGCLLLGPLADDVQLFPAQFGDLGQVSSRFTRPA
jgi:hypothetical protein